MSSDHVPVIDLVPWFAGDESDRREVAARVDAGLCEIGFLVITGHGVPAESRAEIRAAARRFFALPTAVKESYTVPVGQRGWLPAGVEANAYAEGTETPPDLKETYSVGSDQPTGDPVFDGQWFLPNVFPGEVPELEGLLTDYLRRMRTLADELLVVCATALGLEADFFTAHADHPSYAMNINWYPSLATLGHPKPGQFRIGPHTDWGTVTILDRQRGAGGLQVYTPDGRWEDPPYVEDSFIVNIGDLLARWTSDRWKSGRHRVLPPDPSAPDEELMSLIFFYECNSNARVESLGPPIGQVVYEPVLACDYLLEKLTAIAVG
jgi:isopenicillin N synthase-like dioxygenase